MIRQWLEQRRQRKQTAELVSGANAVIARMGALLEGNSGLFMDECRLPLSKAAMKAAFKIAMTVEHDPARFDWLKTGWILLADFQPGIGDTPLSLPPMPEKPTDEFMAELQRYTTMTKTVANESQTLAAELEEFLTPRHNSN